MVIYLYIFISLTILIVVTKDLPISPRFTPYDFLSRCMFSNLNTRQPIVEFSLLAFPRVPLGKKEHKSCFDKNRTHDFRTSRCAGYLLDHSVYRIREKSAVILYTYQVQPECGKRAGWRGMGRPNPYREMNSHARMDAGKCSFSLFSWPRTRLPTLPG